VNDASQLADGPGSILAGRLDGLTDPAVRDLAWLLFSPGLLREQAPLAPLATPWVNAGEALAAARWLLQLDRDPAPLRDALERAHSTRLGRYAETLLGWFLACGPAARLVAANVPLRQAGRTLGECDFLLKSSDGRRLHWELAVKCYLHTGGTEPDAALADFVGPNLRDRFDRKRAHLVNRQMPLSASEEFAALGYGGPWLAQMFVKGWLFYREGAGTQAQPAELAPDHMRGWWVTRSDWPVFAAHRRAAGWSVLPRLAWLAPRRLAAGTDGTVKERDMNERAAIATPVDPEALLDRVVRRDEPEMVAAFADDGANGYVEQSRGFIVPDDWPARAQAFARD
jgi:uncharacterized protein